MKTTNLLERIWIGATRQPHKLLLTIFLSYSAGWVLFEPVIALIPASTEYLIGGVRFALLIIVSVLVGLFRVARPNTVELLFQNNRIIIEFGDLFAQDALRVVPISKFMYEVQVIPISIQALVIKKFVDKLGPEGYDTYTTQLDDALKNVIYEPMVRSHDRGEEKRYRLGTCAVIEENGDNYLLFALTETELKEFIVTNNNCTVNDLWMALDKLWDFVAKESHGRNVSIPLLGTGITGIRLAPQHVLELNILAIVSSIIENGRLTAGEIRIVLHPKYFDVIDLDRFQEFWQQNF